MSFLWYAHHPSLYHQNISETKICIPPKKHLLSFSHLQGKCVRPIWTIFPVNIHGLMVSGLNLLGKHYKAPAEIWEELNNKRACFAHTGNFTTKFFFPRKEALVITHSRCVACPVQVGVSRKNNTFYAGREEGRFKSIASQGNSLHAAGTWFCRPHIIWHQAVFLQSSKSY